jgi:hypothetical protein
MTEQNDDLLAELNGNVMETAATPAEAEELAAAKKVTAHNPLIVEPLPSMTAVAKAEAKMNAAAGDNRIRGYKVTVEGNYSAPSVDTPGRKVKRPYTIEVNLPSLEGALSIIKNKMLDKMLKVKFHDYITYLTHEITNVVPLTPDTPESNNVAYMSATGLLNFIATRGIPLDLRDYDDGRDIRSLRAAVTDYLLNTKDFKAREAKRLAAVKADRELEAMNPGLTSGAETK